MEKKWMCGNGAVTTAQFEDRTLDLQVRLPCRLIVPLDKKLSSTLSHVPWKRGWRYFQRQDNRFNQVNKWAAGT